MLSILRWKNPLFVWEEVWMFPLPPLPITCFQVMTHALEWPSLTVQWLPDVQK
jgi:hypothetical protein